MSIEQAAAAFSTELNAESGTKPAPSSEPSSKPSKAAPMRMFDNLEDNDEGGEEGGAPADTFETDDEGYEQEDQGDVPEDEEPRDGGEDEGDSEEEDPEGEEGGEEDPLFTVMVDGKEVDVPLSEMQRGYIRTETFHQRMSQLDQAAGKLNEFATDVVQNRTKYIDMVKQQEEELQAIMPQEPDWDKLYAENPAQARELEKNFQAFKGKIAEVRAKREAEEKAAAEEQAVVREKFGKEEMAKFIANNKRITNREELAKELNSMHRTAKNLGFSDEEFADVLDSRMLLVLQKASKYDRMMAAKPRAAPPKNGQQKPISPGAGHGKRTAPTGINKAQQRLARTGSVSAATDVFAEMIRPKPKRR